jgi:transmembrane sensor
VTSEHLEEAAKWHARLRDAPHGASSAAVEAGFAAWHAAREEHQRAFARVAHADALARDLSDDVMLRTLGEDALARAGQRRNGSRWLVAGLAGAAIVMPVAALTIRHWASPQKATSASSLRTFSTAVGQRRSVRLAPSTKVLLDTASRLTVEGSVLRVVGQAYLDAGSAPIRLRVPGAEIMTVAGGLNVRATPSSTSVLVEGATATIRPDAPNRPIITLKSGQIVTFRDGRATVKMADDPAAITSWRQGWLLFDDVPLSIAATEINRYRTVPIRVGPGVRAVRISGSFHTDGGDDFLTTVATTLPATVDRAATGPIIVADPTRK